MFCMGCTHNEFIMGLYHNQFIDPAWLVQCCFTGKVSGRSPRWGAWMSVVGISGLMICFFLSAVIGSWHVGTA